MNRYILVDSIPFVYHNGYAYTLFPQNVNKNLKCPKKTLFLRYISNFDSYDTGEWYYIIKDESEDINSYTSKVRNQIRKGLRSNHIERKTEIEIIYSIYSVVNKSYNNKVLTFQQFQKAFELEFTFNQFKIEYWIVYSEKKAIGYSKVAILNKKIAFYEEINIINKYKKNYASYALIYEMNKYYLNSCNVNFVTDGSRNLLHSTHIQEFLIHKFNFRKAYCRLNIAYSFKARLLLLILSPFYNIIKRLNIQFSNKIEAFHFQEIIRKSYN